MQIMGAMLQVENGDASIILKAKRQWDGQASHIDLKANFR